MAFYPNADDVVLQQKSYIGKIYTIISGAVNGNGAITFFFTLSGFVLTIRLYGAASPGVLIEAIVKRLPRLMIPAGASILLGFVILAFAGSSYREAASISGSDWLRDFGNAHFPANFSPSALDAVKQSLLVFLIPNNFYYNSNLWTMVNEFYGSMLVFGIVGLSRMRHLHGSSAVIAIHAGLIVLFSFVHYQFVPFTIGSLLAYLINKNDIKLEISFNLTLIIIASALVGFSFNQWSTNALASVFVLIALLGNREIETRMSSRIGSLVGRLSFPIYLVHTLVILSVSSFVFAQLSVLALSDTVVLAATLSTTLLVSALACLPFLVLDSYWRTWLNVKVRTLVGRAMVTSSLTCPPS